MEDKKYYSINMTQPMYNAVELNTNIYIFVYIEGWYKVIF